MPVSLSQDDLDDIAADVVAEFDDQVMDASFETATWAIEAAHTHALDLRDDPQVRLARVVADATTAALGKVECVLEPLRVLGVPGIAPAMQRELQRAVALGERIFADTAVLLDYDDPTVRAFTELRAKCERQCEYVVSHLRRVLELMAAADTIRGHAIEDRAAAEK